MVLLITGNPRDWWKQANKIGVYWKIVFNSGDYPTHHRDIEVFYQWNRVIRIQSPKTSSILYHCSVLHTYSSDYQAYNVTLQYIWRCCLLCSRWSIRQSTGFHIYKSPVYGSKKATQKQSTNSTKTQNPNAGVVSHLNHFIVFLLTIAPLASKFQF